MKQILALMIWAFAINSALMADAAIVAKQETKTYTQEFCRYSITLPAEWKMVGDESEIIPIEAVSGHYRYIPGVEREIASAEWVLPGEDNLHLEIYMVKRPSGKGISTCLKDFIRNVNSSIRVQDKGTFMISDRPVKWWFGIDDEKTCAYMLYFGNDQELYSVAFHGKNMTTETKEKCEAIMKTFTFVKR
ncbi:MAG: hypothetical protein LLF94_01270 [Chlamydiales bacterium]|nr:hypothetical protein [Chlamydiales bacterium]